MRFKICQIKAPYLNKAWARERAIAKVCNAELANFGFKMLIHELIEVPTNITRSHAGARELEYSSAYSVPLWLELREELLVKY